MLKYSFIKTMEKLTEAPGIKKNTLPRLNYDNIMKREVFYYLIYFIMNRIMLQL